ncbi:hypothetical protein [Rhizobium sp. Root1220]|uniref:hypothetical protein n=1 Tax=Rhizobium sp. Root1220 TaxID=1736432 RepID=UPI0006F60936|nr:hypothetical protein [Rhizobium sp. Root1220]KQV83386.1 hypothetical protein ASC90_20800 [Rhizobium sp. Root1220]
MPEPKIPQLIFALDVAREMAEREGPQADMLVFLIEQALQEAKEEALRRGIVVDVETDRDGARSH